MTALMNQHHAVFQRSIAMKRTLDVFVSITLLLVTAHRLPAPIVEESTTPRPKTFATPKPKPAPTGTARPKSLDRSSGRRTPAPPKQTRSPFAGTWTGVGQWLDNGTTQYYSIRVRDDAKSISLTSSDSDGVPWSANLATRMQGGTLVASSEARSKDFTTTMQLTLNRDGTIRLVRVNKWSDGSVGTLIATLSRQ